jgi:leucyl-tRNA---protein transferase
MFAQVHSPKSLAPEELDHYLEKGWFRMGQTIFTTNFLTFDRQFFSAIWLRVGLEQFTMDKTQQKLFKLNDQFRTEFKEVLIDPVKEKLYAEYKRSVTFEASASLHQLLFGSTYHNVYNTVEVNLYDGAKLIAVGIFDLGKNSAAGITSVYDPSYKKFSLGKYLIYLKMHYCRNLGMKYFYPGYFVPGYFSFDYKLAIGKPTLEYLELATDRWRPIEEFSLRNSPLYVMSERLSELGDLMRTAGVSTRLLKYEFFNVNLIPDLNGAELFDYPLLLHAEESDHPMGLIIVYDCIDSNYHLYLCRSLWNSHIETRADEFYASNLLIAEKDISTSEDASDMVEFFASKKFREM